MPLELSIHRCPQSLDLTITAPRPRILAILPAEATAVLGAAALAALRCCSPAAVALQALCALLTAAATWASLSAVSQESVRLLPGVGLALETRPRYGRTSRQFYELGSVDSVVINEGVTATDIRYLQVGGLGFRVKQLPSTLKHQTLVSGTTWPLAPCPGAPTLNPEPWSQVLPGALLHPPP